MKISIIFYLIVSFWLIGIGGIAHAGMEQPPVPEISAGLAPMAIALVVGIFLAYREFTRRK